MNIIKNISNICISKMRRRSIIFNVTSLVKNVDNYITRELKYESEKENIYENQRAKSINGYLQKMLFMKNFNKHNKR